ncbi:polar growth protein [Onygenales sp. PD_10]|nr:polar growth protein [Onygenales sp. PD_10]
MPHTPELPHGVRPGDVLIVVHDFEARGADELTLRRGDKVELLELDEGFGDGWYLGKHIIENRTGLFPGVYTTTAPKISVRQPASQASNSSTPSKPRRNSEPPGSPKVVENSVDTVSPGSNDDITPQASRQVSGTDFKPPILESDDSTTSHQQGPNTAPPPVSTVPLSPTVQRTISEAMSSRRNGEDSPVMNETLSVIDEHITNFNTPRHSFVAQEPRNTNDSGSEYSSHIDHRMSYIPGAETDEEEEAGHSESTIRSWDHRQTSQHLRELGVDAKHCDIFEEQEITGDVLLEMDQEFIYMKEFNFGVMGRRLKTWHIIKTFQEEVKGIKRPRQSSSTFSGRDSSADEFDRSQSRAGGSFLPRIPSLTEGHGQNQRRSRGTSSPKPPSGVTASISSTLSSNASPVSPLSQSMGFDASSRPSAASVRQINHARPHSSMDSSPMSPPPNIRTSKANHGASGDKKSSFDRGWTMAGGSQGLNNRPDGASGDPIRQQTFPGLDATGSESSLAADSADLDRGYFSGGELDMRKSRNVLKKQQNSLGRSYSHSRNSSAADDLKQIRNKRHSRFGSADSIRDLVPHVSSSPKIYQSGSLKGRPGDHRTKESFGDQSHAPTVTNLEGTNSQSHGIFSAFSPLYSKTDGEGSGRSSPLPSAHLKNVAPKVRRAIGLRAISDAVTGNEKALVSSPTSTTSNKDSPKSPTRTNSSTPSGASKSFEIESTDGSGKPIEGAFALVTLPKAAAARSKSKKDTSAYVRGLEKKTPQEQMIGCDYCGWMKKKSSNLMTTWKPRLFVLRGRRLSYYYSEDDTEERGLIDISSHRVFRADQDTITSLHATITGAKASPTSPMNFNPPSPDTDIVSDISSRPKSTSSDAPFIFKLVPPKAGLSRAVQFTKPSIHFFQVDNIQQGRLWMAALMKATIERDLNLPVRTTNKQKTISLKQARATNQRPPALMAAEARNNPEKKPDSESNGHAVQGLNIETPETNGDGKNASDEFQKLEASDTGSSTLVS